MSFIRKYAGLITKFNAHLGTNYPIRILKNCVTCYVNAFFTASLPLKHRLNTIMDVQTVQWHNAMAECNEIIWSSHHHIKCCCFLSVDSSIFTCEQGLQVEIGLRLVSNCILCNDSTELNRTQFSLVAEPSKRGILNVALKFVLRKIIIGIHPFLLLVTFITSMYGL